MRMNSKSRLQEGRNERLISRVGAFAALAKGVWIATPRVVVSRILFASAIIAIAGSSPKASFFFDDVVGALAFGAILSAIGVSFIQKIQVEKCLGVPLAHAIHRGRVSSAFQGVDPAEALCWMRIFDATRLLGIIFFIIALGWPKGGLDQQALEHFSQAPIQALISEAKSAGANLNEIALERIVAAETGELWGRENSLALEEQRRSAAIFLILLVLGAMLISLAISSGALFAAKVEWRLLMATAVDMGQKAVGAIKRAGPLVEKGLAAIVIVSERDKDALRTRAKMENEKTGARNGS